MSRGLGGTSTCEGGGCCNSSSTGKPLCPPIPAQRACSASALRRCRKVAKAYFSLLEVLCHNHTGTIACQEGPTFAFILNSLDQVRPLTRWGFDIHTAQEGGRGTSTQAPLPARRGTPSCSAKGPRYLPVNFLLILLGQNRLAVDKRTILHPAV
jgi:hypothetical protein